MPGRQVFTLMGVRAVFDGTGAGGAFLPCVKILSDAGTVMAQTVGSSVAAGSSADVTFAPFLEAAATTGGGGIQFDVSPQSGGFLEATATSGGTAFDLVASAGGAFNIESSGGGGGFVSITTSDGEVFIGSTSIVNRLATGGAFEVQAAGAVRIMRIFNSKTIEIRATTLDVSATTEFVFALPTVNPGGTNRLWNNAGVVNIT